MAESRREREIPIRQAIVVELAGASQKKPLILRNGTASVQL